MIRRAAILIADTAVILAIAACTGNGPVKSTNHPSPAATATTSGPLVTKRAGRPTDINAPGIQMPVNAHISFKVGSHTVFIPGATWDTIATSTRVAANVGVKFASGFTWTATTRNRFQYMADLIAKDEGSKNFDPLAIATTIKNGTVISTVALYNPGDRPGTLFGLHLRIISRPGEKLIADGDFFASADSSILIPAKTITFATLYCPLITQPKTLHHTRHITDHFHYDNFAYS